MRHYAPAHTRPAKQGADRKNENLKEKQKKTKVQRGDGTSKISAENAEQHYQGHTKRGTKPNRNAGKTKPGAQ